MVNTNPEARYDVVVIECRSRRVTNIVGKARRLSGNTSAESLEDLMYTRCNAEHMPLIVLTGAYKVDDIVPEGA